MKKLMCFFVSLALVALAACGDKDGRQAEAADRDTKGEESFGDEISNGIKPFIPAGEASDELTAFFDENLWRISNSIFRGYDQPDDVFTDSCVMINSVEEFQAIDFIGDMTFELPAIDFDVRTLVIGKYVAMHGGYYLVSQNIVVEPETVIMNIRLGTHAPHDDMIHVNYFWGLYPKLPQGTIGVNILKEMP